MARLNLGIVMSRLRIVAGMRTGGQIRILSTLQLPRANRRSTGTAAKFTNRQITPTISRPRIEIKRTETADGQRLDLERPCLITIATGLYRPSRNFTGSGVSMNNPCRGLFCRFSWAGAPVDSVVPFTRSDE